MGSAPAAFRTVLADPPWRFSDRLPGPSRGAAKNYRVLSPEEMCAMGPQFTGSPDVVPPFLLPPIADDAWLFLWRVASQVEEAYRVVRAWGFAPKSEIVWCKFTSNGKRHFGMGRYVRASHEVCIVATRGRVRPVDRSVRSTFEATVGRHSEKPAYFYDLVERLTGPDAAPRIELFARARRPGWSAIGDELGRAA